MRKNIYIQAFLGLLALMLTVLGPQHPVRADSSGQGGGIVGQSPIDIPNSELRIRKLPQLRAIYHSGDILDEVCLEIKNGEKVYSTPLGLEAVPQVVAKITARKNNFLRLADKVYEPISFHWHTPAEHYINGQQAAMEVHIVHQEVFFNETDFVKNRIPETLIVAVLYVEGKENREIETIFSEFERFQQQQCVDTGAFDLEALLPSRNLRTTFRYLGSATESDDNGAFQTGVTWIVLTEPLTASAAQIFSHRHVVDGIPLSAFPFLDTKTKARQKPLVGNTRAIQSLAGRIVFTDLWPSMM